MSIKDHLFNTAKSFVMTQGRMLYKNIRDNSKYIEEFAKGQIPTELGQKAKENVINQLKNELQSDAFANTAKDAIGKGLDILVERAFTEHKNETGEKICNC